MHMNATQFLALLRNGRRADLVCHAIASAKAAREATLAAAREQIKGETHDVPVETETATFYCIDGCTHES